MSVLVKGWSELSSNVKQTIEAKHVEFQPSTVQSGRVEAGTAWAEESRLLDELG
jgi:hypothetical protein